MKVKKYCKECGAKPGEEHLIGCSKEENRYVKVTPISEVEATFVDFKIKGD